jgi:hypothetical protein
MAKMSEDRSAESKEPNAAPSGDTTSETITPDAIYRDEAKLTRRILLKTDTRYAQPSLV